MNIFEEYEKAKLLYRLKNIRKYVVPFFNDLQQHKDFGNLCFKDVLMDDLDKVSGAFNCPINVEYFESFSNDELLFSQYNKSVFLNRLKAYEERWGIVVGHYDFRSNLFFRFIVAVREDFRRYS